MKDHWPLTVNFAWSSSNDHRLLSSMASAAPVPGFLIGYQKGGDPAMGRIVLVAIVVAAVVAFAVLQLRARSSRRSPVVFDWRTFPPPRYDPELGDRGRDMNDEAQFGNQENYGLQWEYWTQRGYGGAPRPWNPDSRGTP
jgi:hypothetical protein